MSIKEPELFSCPEPFIVLGYNGEDRVSTTDSLLMPSAFGAASHPEHSLTEHELTSPFFSFLSIIICKTVGAAGQSNFPLLAQLCVIVISIVD